MDYEGLWRAPGRGGKKGREPPPKATVWDGEWGGEKAEERAGATRVSRGGKGVRKTVNEKVSNG